MKKKPDNISKDKDSHAGSVTALKQRITELEKQLDILTRVEEALRVSENNLRTSETRLRRAEIASRSGNWELHLKTGMMIGSDGAVKLYGVQGSPMDYDIIKKIPLPEFRPMMDRALDDLINLGKPYDIEFKIKKADSGEIIDLHSVCEYDRENMILFGSIQDITERKKAEKVIMRNNRDLAHMLQITLDLLETVEKKEVFRRILEGAIRLTELDTGAIYFLSGGILTLEATFPPLPPGFPDEFRKAKLECHTHIKRAVAANNPLIVRDIREVEISPEEKLIVDNRNLRSVLYIPLTVKKEVVGILIIGTVDRIYDFTDREIRLGRTLSNIASLTLENSYLFDNLTVAKEKAEESDRLKTAFLHNVSHEIRTPLNAIVGFSGFLDQPDLGEKERQEYINIIFQSNNQLLSVINDILNISHLETGQARVNISPVNISVFMKNLHAQFISEAKRKNIALRIKTLDKESSTFVETDEGKLLQILSNLLSNALKFTSAGHIEIGYECKDDHAEFYVEDTGIGIPEHEQSRIFERFYQIDKSESRTYGGTGLGLSISKGFVELLGGKIWLKSVPGSGSVFYFSIPCSKSVASAIIDRKEPFAAVKHQKKIRSILIAEDEESNYALISTILRHRNFNLIRARNGQEAVDQFRMNPDVDLILMDIKMPVMNGFEAAAEIFKIKPQVPVIAQTAYAHLSDRTLAMEIGFVDYLSKPFDREQLITLVDKYLG